MNVHLVSYDLRAPGRNYGTLHEYLQTFNWAKPLESVWLIQTALSATQLRDGVLRHIDANDRVLVVEITNKEIAWRSIPAAVATWINNNV